MKSHATDVAGSHHKSKRRITRRGPTRFPGVTQDARALKVHRATLYRVLTGEWAKNLPGLRRRYLELKRRQRQEAA